MIYSFFSNADCCLTDAIILIIHRERRAYTIFDRTWYYLSKTTWMNAHFNSMTTLTKNREFQGRIKSSVGCKLHYSGYKYFNLGLPTKAPYQDYYYLRLASLNKQTTTPALVNIYCSVNQWVATIYMDFHSEILPRKWTSLRVYTMLNSHIMFYYNFQIFSLQVYKVNGTYSDLSHKSQSSQAKPLHTAAKKAGAGKMHSGSSSRSGTPRRRSRSNSLSSSQGSIRSGMPI